MADTSVPRPRSQPLRRETGTFYFPTQGVGSWPVAEKETFPLTKTNSHLKRGEPPPALKHSATMPTLGRITTDGTTTSQQFIKVESSPELARNGVSKIRSIMEQLGLSNIPGLGSLTVNFPTIGLPPLVYPAFGLGMPALEAPPWLPDIEVKSKHKKDAFGRKKWKQMRAVLDTGCTAGNWVSLDTLDDLGMKEFNKLPLTEVENLGAQTVGGVTVRASGVVNLTWRGIPGQNGRGNCSRNFKMRFLVLENSEPAPFQILIGSESIWKCGILQAPIFMAKGNREIVGLPAEPKPKGDKKLPWAERRAANDKALKEKKEKEAAQKHNTAALQANGNTADKSKQAPNGPVLARTDSHLSIESVKSHQNEALERVRTLTSESKKTAKDCTKPSSSPSKSPSAKITS